MRSIRRSLLGYLLLLLALALSAVGALVDRFANAAIRSREAAEEKRIDQVFKARQSEAKSKFDADLMAETKALAKEVRYKTATLLLDFRGPRRLPDSPPVRAPDEVAQQYRLRTQLLLLANPGVPIAMATAAGAVEPRRGAVTFPAPEVIQQYRLRTQLLLLANPAVSTAMVAAAGAIELRRAAITFPAPLYPGAPGWIAFDAPRFPQRLHDALRKSFEDDEHAGNFQITILAHAPAQQWDAMLAVHPARLPVALPLDSDWLEPRASELEPRFDEIDVPGKGQCGRVVTATHAGRPLHFSVWLPPPTMPAPVPGPGYRPAFNRPWSADLYLRLVVQVVRPYSELAARLATDQQEREDQIAQVQSETQMELSTLRARLIVIGAVTFAALVLGGWFFVARGLAPLHTLSDAVSRVSEKDFRLPIGADGLGRELAPIHSRITQTLTLLQRAFAREKQAVADISHELRTPIASLLATIDVALRKPRTPEQYRTALEECRLITKQLGELVERIMTLALLDAGNDQTQIARTDASELARGCAAVIRPLAAANTINLSSRVEEDLVLDTDAGKLREVLINLLHNAVEYNRPDGTIEMTARRDGDAVVFEVRDTGIGMTADVRERIFERFYRADASRHATGIHAGLGLAIVKEYVARMNGSITVASEPDAGTTFRVTLPAPLDPDSPARPQARGVASIRL